MKGVGAGGNFLGAEHTASHFRTELWEPRLFGREMLIGWQGSGGKTDAGIAMDIYHDIIGREPLPVRISETIERKMLDIIRRATGVRVGPVEPE